MPDLLRRPPGSPAFSFLLGSSTIAFASSTGGAARTLAALAAGGFLVVLVGTAASGRGGIASPVAWRSPAPERRRAGLLRPGRRRHRRVRTPTTTGSGTAWKEDSMLQLREMDDRVPLADQLSEEVGPV